MTRLARRRWPAIITAALAATAAVMPGFTVGALAPSMQDALHTSRTTLGLAMSAFYAASALGSPVAKRLAARLPVPVALSAAAMVASLSMLALSRAGHVAVLFPVLVVAGFANGLVQPAAGRLIAARAPDRRRSLAAGTIGAALGAGTLVPGLLVALVVHPYGWRAAMAIAGLLALAPVALAPLTRTPAADRRRTAAASAPMPRAVRRTLVLWAVAAALSATGNNAVASYFVQLGAHSGVPDGLTGELLALSAVIAIAVRLVAGALADRAPRGDRAVIAGMMLSGAAGLALIAAGNPVAFLAGAVLAFSAGWGWTGLLLSAALRLLPDRAENAGHTVQVGVYTGATIAPFTFGALSASLGFAAAALLAAVAALAAATLMATTIPNLYDLRRAVVMRPAMTTARRGSACGEDAAGHRAEA
ncbi:MFS transporter [Actinomadura montaniterrae]|uniref:MFS transporter n=1 Tax=Actinomadura montaniterrae TaxID=1803903 RepID=A0A6L3VV35_9ACTN|nr:MFS transporter [Actinomadura montaniterrae]KAB2382733.1 MFS transporter [Actinomadura montaniterrae]